MKAQNSPFRRKYEVKISLTIDALYLSQQHKMVTLKLHNVSFSLILTCSYIFTRSLKLLSISPMSDDIP